jgi:hypothetical protein
LEHCCIIEVDLESIVETVVEINKAFHVVNLKARYEHIEEERVVYNAPTLPTTNGRPTDITIRIPLPVSTNYCIEEKHYSTTKKLKKATNKCFTTYTNSKGRCFDNVTLEGFDKLSANYLPWTTFKPNSGANYTIRTLFNTSINHIIGTFGFTAVEHFGETAIKASENKYLYGIHVSHGPSSLYNIVHFVHGRRTWRGEAPVTRRELLLRNF